ncbi:MFS transporter [Mycolicibacterium aubagnense]|uniref:MFS transporter n=1 Tax=Mycolicibacterium aubagnense TaxID=319707 RepID=A0ABM7IN59_9MYCO|nr:MFS transporter [Mycolicibacterium aubagnense]BBX88165.1 hypothetical protein MAUB_63660 [Mycolicibacterium aubagnense]
MAGLAAIVLVALTLRRSQLQGGSALQRRSVGQIARGYFTLLRQQRARRTYGYVLINAVIHSGIYTWLGVYFSQRFGLTLVGIGLALLLYGVPGFLFGPAIGRLADRYGRTRLIPLGLAVASTAALLLALPVPLILAALAVGMLSLGYDLTQPLLAGIVTQLSAQRGQAMGLNVCTLFIGFGAGSLLFQALLTTGFTAALATFSTGRHSPRSSACTSSPVRDHTPCRPSKTRGDVIFHGLELSPHLRIVEIRDETASDFATRTSPGMFTVGVCRM